MTDKSTDQVSDEAKCPKCGRRASEIVGQMGHVCSFVPKREFEYCPTCGGELDTGWECNKCGLDWREWVLQPPTIQVETEQ